ncbi:MAG: DUF4340 domain-containing protein [Gemmatimonadales bacterium]
MNPKTLKRIVVILGVALLLWGLSGIIGGGRDAREAALMFPAVGPNGVDTVTIVRSRDTTRLLRNGDDWTVNGFKASNLVIKRLFNALKDSNEAELVSTSSLVHKRMQVDDSAGISVRLVSGGDELASLVFGKRGQQYNSSYVRMNGQDYVYLYLGTLTSLVRQTVDEWRDKTVVMVEPDSVGRIVARRGARRYTLSKRGDEWLVGRVTADSAAVRRLLGQYDSLQANGFATEQQADSLDFARPVRTIALLGSGGDTLAHLVFDSTSSAFWVRKASGGTIYKILSWKADQLVPKDSTLRKK